MIDKIIEKLKNKKIAILGFGREGKTTYHFIRQYLPMQKLVIIDALDIKDEVDIIEDKNCKVISGPNYLDNLDSYDLVIKSPGISLKDIDTSKLNITSEIELLLEVAKDRVIGVTGTKGKSTTSSLIYSILKENNYHVVLAGNIGIPVFTNLEATNDKTIFVIEMSSHQLEFLKYSPHIGIILNLFEDHLDHAGSVEHYHNIKMNMFRYQNESDYMIYCQDNENLRKKIKENNFKGKPYPIDIKKRNASIYLDGEFIYSDNKIVFSKNLKRNLVGIYNLKNIMVAFQVSRILHLNDELTLKAISEFKTLNYRLELVGEVDDIKYYVDTLATIPEATKESIQALENVNTLIFGGMDRGISYEGFAKYLEKTKIEHFICMPTTGHTIGKELPTTKTYFVDTLEEAVKIAKKLTKKNTICLLSPAASSYEQFKNYAEKGDKFKEYIWSK